MSQERERRIERRKDNQAEKRIRKSVRQKESGTVRHDLGNRAVRFESEGTTKRKMGSCGRNMCQKKEEVKFTTKNLQILIHLWCCRHSSTHSFLEYRRHAL